MVKIVLAAALVLVMRFPATGQVPLYAQPGAPPEDRITDLLAHMTLAEKIGALGTNPTVPRLGIVGTGHVEGLHGLALGGPGGWEGRRQTVIPTTQFPQARGLGQTWDPALLQQAAAVEAYETRYAFGKYHRGGLVVRAPNADLSRDPRWGRSEESYGEDPFLTGTLATAFTRGLQGNSAVWTTASLLKHFLANSNEDGRGGSSSNFDERLFHEYYSVPFRMAIEEGHADAMMTSYNAWNHVPMTANPVLRDVVMKDWGFDGILCTDAGALTNMVKEHHAYKTMPEATAAAIHAGINQFLDEYTEGLQDALKQQLVTEADLDRNLRGVFRVMLRLGLWNAAPNAPQAAPNASQAAMNAPQAAMIGIAANPAGEPALADPWMWPDHRALARKVTEESIVLLKNAQHLLPLQASALHTIAVIGPLADKVALDWYSGTPPYTVTPVAGIRSRAGAGASVIFNDGSDLSAVAALARTADVVVVVIGNHPTCDAGWMKCPLPSDGKEAVDRKSLQLAQEDIAKAAFAANPKTIVVLQASFPYTTVWTQQNIPAVLEMTHNSQEQGNALADVLFGDYNPAGRLTQTWVAAESDLPPMMDYNLRDGRTYLYSKTKPLYAFGHGLSYTDFRYANLRLSEPRISKGGTATVSVDIQNAGGRAGDEVAQLYVSWPGSAVQRPLQALVGFERVAIKPGETRTVNFSLPASSLAYWQASRHAFELEGGTVRVAVGGSSDNLPLSTMIRVTP